MKKPTTIKLVLAGLFVALGLLLPVIFHAVGMSGAVFSPMHIPVLLCGFICGYKLGAVAGLIVPLLSSVFTGMPVLYPVAIYMMLELAAYGAVAGLMAKKTGTIPALLTAMICGRVVLGIAQAILLTGGGQPFVFQSFVTGAFVTSLPGIILQLLLVPGIIQLLKRAKFYPIEG